MDKEIRKEIKNLECQERKINNIIKMGENFILTKGKYYKNVESIEALNEMNRLLSEYMKQDKLLKDKVREMRKKFQTVCLHEVTIEDDLNCICAFCDRLMIYDKTNTILNIKLPFSMGYIGTEALIDSNDQYNGKRVQDRIEEIIENGLESEDTITYIEDSLEDLQYTSNIKVRRLK